MINLLKIFFPNTIADKPIEGGSVGNSTDTKDNAFSPNSIPSNEIIFPVVANDIVSMSLNTQARQILGGYSFGQVGSLAVGKYVAGVSGDIRISPSGIVGRNSSGTNTFTIDGTTGSATFLGTVTATAGSIGGFTIASGYLYAGTSTNTCGLSPADYPFWAGATYANRATAPFRVTPAGAITASSGTVGGLVISATSISTSSGDNKIVIDNSDNVSFYAGGTLRGSLRGATATGATGIIADCDLVIANSRSFMMKSSGGGATEYAGLGLATNDMWLTLGTADKLYIKNNAQDTNMFTISTTRTYSELDMFIGGTDSDHQVATRKWVDDNYVAK